MINFIKRMFKNSEKVIDSVNLNYEEFYRIVGFSSNISRCGINIKTDKIRGFHRDHYVISCSIDGVEVLRVSELSKFDKPQLYIIEVLKQLAKDIKIGRKTTLENKKKEEDDIINKWAEKYNIK